MVLNFTKHDSIPVLPKRRSNLNKFSTYIVICNENNQLALQWKHQPSLQRNLKLYEDKHPEFSNLFRHQDKGIDIANFWRKVAFDESQLIADWEPSNKTQLAYEHLASYFEEKCYWAAKDLCKDRNVNSWEEYLCIARLLVYNPLKLKEILVKYNSKSANIDTYLTNILINHIKYSAEVHRFSRWRLLYKKSDKELIEALKALGIIEPEISLIIFARKYFKQVYLINKIKNTTRNTGKKWIAPDEEDFSKSAQCYNVEKGLPTAPHEVFANSTKVTAKQIQDWMEICIKALKSYPISILPKFSLDAFQGEFEVKSELQAPEIEWEKISSSENTREQGFLANQANSILSEQLQSMKLDERKILLLYYGFGLNQKQLADRLGMNQSTISRYLTKSTIKLLEAIARISQPQQWVKGYVRRWLESEYHAPVHSDLIQAVLVSAIKKLVNEEREILQLYYGEQMDEIKIASQLGISLNEIATRLTKTRNHLQEKLMQEINIWIKEYLEKWLINYYKSLLKVVLKKEAKSGNKELKLEEKIFLVEIYTQNQLY
ncbi:sigma-70 family RNA polymerase sigma factor [Nostoc sp. 'Lobaria pulmonaria (5183) cyanobiont']|uniref:sigma-70 family RNA polymerase sigma factor n=1 Tax=Nostoc sp. 'Lobaria pulmonaria (5183) cyanobiont' TaxID=1618022 RepID=UPI000CF31F57|nr:sigma-70 family RNA polymerase sigma factor [Nostoc sp. 'Lobaria pulmonaria (5183) cyanobiont']AVH71557.1 RNA polymerase sigma factor [Nostoc sp. 'Lobaria pulmonaria (5183) cyanobiont']